MTILISEDEAYRRSLRVFINEYDRHIVIKEGHGQPPGFNYRPCLVLLVIITMDY